jgi:2,4-dienoyl-CoA reductase-like NADH-dependent reductase (Old Yellow Enzyme family)
MHTFRLDTKDGQNFAFETVQHGSQSVTKLADVSVYPSMATTPNALNTAMMQVQYAATRLPVIDSHQTPENTTVQMVAVADEAKFDATGNINLIACAHVVPQHDGFELQTERTLTHAEIQSVMAHIPQNDNTVFSDETYADAVDALKQSAGVRNDGQAYTRYFVIGDAAFAYDGHNLSIQRAGDDKPFVKEVKELDSEAIQDAYADYAKAIADAEHDVPEAAEHEAGNK